MTDLEMSVSADRTLTRTDSAGAVMNDERGITVGNVAPSSSSSFVSSADAFGIDAEESPSVTSSDPQPAPSPVPLSSSTPQPPPTTPSSSSVVVANPQQTIQAPAQQQGGDLATANRLLRTCRTVIDQLNKQLAHEKEENGKLKEEFAKYKVRTEVARKNSELEITNLSEVNRKFKQYNVVSHDAQAELEMLRKRFEHMEKERTEAMEEVHRLNRQLANEKTARKRAEEEVQEMKRKTEAIGPEALEQAKQQLSEELNDIKREFRIYRERTANMLEEKDAEVIRARTSSEASTELAYLRDVILKYLASSNDPAARNSMEAAIASVLRFNQAEVDYVKEKRRHDLGWKVALSSLGI